MKIDCEYSLKVSMDVILPDDYTKDVLDDKIREEGLKKMRYYLSGFMEEEMKKIITEEIKLKNTKYASI